MGEACRRPREDREEPFEPVSDMGLAAAQEKAKRGERG